MMHQARLQHCITCSFSPLRPAAPSCVARPFSKCSLNSSINGASPGQGVRVQAWTQVVDQASGKPYYWNTATNETAWELPSGVDSTPVNTTTTTSSSSSTSTTSSSSSSTSTTSSSSSSTRDASLTQQQPDTMSNDAIFDALATAYSADGSGMQFWEVARAHRQYGVFDPPYFDYLEQRQKAAADESEKELAFKMMCRLANPLLRQPAPFE